MHSLGCRIDQELTVSEFIIGGGFIDLENMRTKLPPEAKNTLARTVDYSNSSYTLIQQRTNNRLCGSSGPDNDCGFTSQAKSGIRVAEGRDKAFTIRIGPMDLTILEIYCIHSTQSSSDFVYLTNCLKYCFLVGNSYVAANEF